MATFEEVLFHDMIFQRMRDLKYRYDKYHAGVGKRGTFIMQHVLKSGVVKRKFDERRLTDWMEALQMGDYKKYNWAVVMKKANKLHRYLKVNEGV